MSKVNITCLLSPMIDTEGPMNINGQELDGAKYLMGKYGEIDLETTITFGSDHPDCVHTDLITIGNQKQVTSIQQTSIAMIQPGTHKGTLGVHALYRDDMKDQDPFSIASMLVAMIENLENRPDLILAGRDSSDYAHGIVGASVAQKLGMPYYSGVSEIHFTEDFKSVSATFMDGSDQYVCDISLPAVFGTTDHLNGKDSARFTSLKGVMMAKRFKRNVVDESALNIEDGSRRTEILEIREVKTDRRNQRIEEGEGAEKVKQAVTILVDQDKCISGGGAAGGASGGASAAVSFDSMALNEIDLSQDLVLVADHDQQHLRLSTMQALTPIKALAGALGKKVTVLIFAQDGATVASDLADSGVDRVMTLTSDQFKHAHLELLCKAVDAVLTASQPSHLFFVSHDVARDTAATIASKFHGGLLQDVMSLSDDGGAWVGERVVANARFITREKIASGGLQVATIRPTAFDPAEGGGQPVFVAVSLPEFPVSLTLKEFTAGAEVKGIPLNEAKVVIAGGRGMKAEENFGHLDRLAEVLTGAVGGSRAVTDLGWLPHNLQIGQTGTKVAPDVYFAIGISGAIQHLTGMMDSKYVVAINSDPEAPIHQYADLSIIDKWENVLQPLTEALGQAIG